VTETQIYTRLTQADLKAIEARVSLEAGEVPTLESLQAEGYQEDTRLNSLIDFISAAGRTLTLLIAEFLQACAVLIVCALFTILEYQRVLHGALALGQLPEAAQMIAVAIVAANVIHPIYRLRQLRGQEHLQITRVTLRGSLESCWKRLTGKSEVVQVDLYHNSTLHVAASIITWSTVLLAVYDLLSPLLNQIFAGAVSRPLPILLMEFLMGLGLSVAGVFFLQSAAHEIGVRTLTDQPKRLTDILQIKQQEYDERVTLIRERVTAEYMTAKVEDQARQKRLIQLDKAGEITVPFSINGAREHMNGKA